MFGHVKFQMSRINIHCDRVETHHYDMSSNHFLKLYFVYFMSTVNDIYPWGFKFSAKLKTQKGATALVPVLSQPNPCIQLSAVSAWWPTTRIWSSWLRSSLLICQFNARVWYQICGKSCPTPHKQNNIYTFIMKSLNVTSDTSFIFHTW